MTIAVVGAGLIGGSLLRALAAADRRAHLVVESDPHVREAVAEAGLAEHVRASLDDTLARCDVVVLATPIAVVESCLEEASRRMHDGSVLTDVAGTKSAIVAAAATRVRRGVAFVGAHPMFGGDRGGFGASDGSLWRSGVVAVCTDGAAREAIDRVVALHASLGAQVVECTADAHDRAVAAVSHLPYVVASALALVGRDAGPLAARLAGRGFDDTTRLAGFSYDVQGVVARRNAHLADAIAALRSALDALTAEDETVARARFDEARAASDARRSMRRKGRGAGGNDG